MSSRDYVTALFILVVLLIGLYALNVYIIQPVLTPKFATVSAAPEQRAPRNQRMDSVFKPAGKARNIVATTLEKIRGMFPKKEYSDTFEPRQVTRNPFFWPHEATTPEQRRAEYEKSMKDTAAAESTGTRLKMVIMGENKKIALINNQILFEGSQYGEDTVTNIFEKEVVLNGPSGETRLMMAQAMPFSPAADAAAGAEPQKKTPAQEESVDRLFNKLKPFLEKGQQKELEKIKKARQK